MKPVLSTTKTHRLCIPLPRWGTYYDINTDEDRYGQQLLVIGWHIEFQTLFLRVGLARFFIRKRALQPSP